MGIDDGFELLENDDPEAFHGIFHDELNAKEKAIVFDPSVFVSMSDDQTESRIEVFYQTRMDMVKGSLTLKPNNLTFEAYTKKNEEENATS